MAALSLKPKRNLILLCAPLYLIYLHGRYLAQSQHNRWNSGCSSVTQSPLPLHLAAHTGAGPRGSYCNQPFRHRKPARVLSLQNNLLQQTQHHKTIYKHKAPDYPIKELSSSPLPYGPLLSGLLDTGSLWQENLPSLSEPHSFFRALYTRQ